MYITMPWVPVRNRRRRYRRKPFVRWGKVGRGGMRAARMRLSPKVGEPVFTETLNFGQITFNQTSPGLSTFLLRMSLNQIPQVGDYTALYNQYCIKRLQWILMPAYNVYDQPALGTSVATAPRLVYAIQDSANQTTPASEVDVLQDNGCKIRMFTKPIRIAHVPVPNVQVGVSSGGFISESKRNRWFDTQRTDVAHSGVALSFTNDIPVAGTPALCTVYCKVTFALRDPK